MRNVFYNKITVIVLHVFVISLFFLHPLYAEPDQRIIIYFNQPVTGNNKIKMQEHLKRQLHRGYSLAEHSSDLRWIIILQSPLNNQQLKDAKNNLLENALVKHVELDMLLEKKATIQTQ